MRQTFPAAYVPRIYAWTGTESYNVELPFNPVETKPGRYAEFPFGIGVVTGFNSLCGYDDGLLAELFAAPQEITLRLGATSSRRLSVRCRILDSGKIIKEFDPAELNLIPGIAVTRKFAWDSSVAPDGTYTLEVSCGKAKFLRELRIDHAAEKAKKKDQSARLSRLRELQEQYRKNPSKELRMEILRLANE